MLFGVGGEERGRAKGEEVYTHMQECRQGRREGKATSERAEEGREEEHSLAAVGVRSIPLATFSFFPARLHQGRRLWGSGAKTERG